MAFSYEVKVVRRVRICALVLQFINVLCVTVLFQFETAVRQEPGGAGKLCKCDGGGSDLKLQTGHYEL